LTFVERGGCISSQSRRPRRGLRRSAPYRCVSSHARPLAADLRRNAPSASPTQPQLTFALRRQLLAGSGSGEAGVRQVLVVAGDNSDPAGEYTSGLQILESGLLEQHGIKTVGVAGHPEGHRVVGDEVLRDALRRKNAYKARTGANVYVVTQFAFTADPVLAWEASHGTEIAGLPVVVGLPGLATAKTLLKYAMDCGVGASLSAFSKQYASLTKLLMVSAPDEAIVSLATHKEKTPSSPLAGVHFFPFGGFKKTADWANKVAAGQFEVTPSGGLKVD